jgi:hypothetical protein
MTALNLLQTLTLILSAHTFMPSGNLIRIHLHLFYVTCITYHIIYQVQPILTLDS